MVQRLVCSDVRHKSMRIHNSLIGVLLAFLVVGCESEKGIYLDHKSEEIRLNGALISTEKLIGFISNPDNAEVEVTVMGEEGIEHTSAGDLDEGLSDLLSVFLSYDGPEAYFESDDSLDGPDPFPETKQAEQDTASNPLPAE